MSPQLEPATDFDGAQDAVMALILRPQIDTFALKLVEKRVNALANSDACGRFELLSALAARVGDIEEAARLFEAAFNAEPSERVSTVVRHMGLMQSTLQLGRVREVFEAYYPLLRNTPDAVRDASNVLCMCGFFYTAARLNDDMDRLNMPSQPFEPRALLMLDEAGVTEDDLAAVIQHALEFLRAEHKFPEHARANFLGSLEGDAGALIEFSTQGDAESVAALEWRLFESLADKSFPAVDSGFLSLSLLVDNDRAVSCQ